MLNSTEGSCLRSDFQVFIDPLAGRIYHIDFDRCFGGFRETWCPEELQSYVEYLIKSRGGSAPDYDSEEDDVDAGNGKIDGHSDLDGSSNSDLA